MSVILLLALSVLPLFCSCTKEGADSIIAEELALQMVPSESSDDISSVNLMIYDSKGKLVYAKYSEKDSLHIKMPFQSGETYHFYAIANTENVTTDGKIRDTLSIRELFHTFRQVDNLDEANNLPLSGKVSKNDFDGEHCNLKIELSRLISKFRIIVDTSGLDNSVKEFDIKRVSLKNINRNVHYFKSSKAETLQDVMGVGESKSGDELASLFTTGVDLYLPENAQGNLLDGNRYENEHIPPEPYNDLASYVEIVVRYRSTVKVDDSLVYRYYLHNGRMLDNFDVLRNTMYVCHTNFSGDGINENGWRIDVSGMKDLVQEITLSPRLLEFTQVGQMKRLTATISPSSAQNPYLSWRSTDPSVATVDTRGTVTAVSDGQCRIIAQATDESGVSSSSEVKVDTFIYIDSIAVEPDSLELFVAKSAFVNVIFYPSNAQNKNLIWRCSAPDIIFFESSGEVTGMSVGSCILTVTTVEGKHTKDIFVRVKDRSFSGVEIPQVLYPGYNTPLSLEWSAQPQGTPRFSLNCVDGDPDGAYISSNTLYATNTKGDYHNNCTIGTYEFGASLNNVTQKVIFEVNTGSVVIDKSSVPSPIYLGQKIPLTFSERIPSDVPITYSSNNPAGVTVNSDNEIVPLSVGRYIVRASSVCGAGDSVRFNIAKPSLSISSEFSIYEGMTSILTYTSVPASGMDVEWKILSGNAYINLTADGRITGIRRSAGSIVRIRAYFKDYPTVYSDADVVVQPAVKASFASGDTLLNVSSFPGTATVKRYPVSVRLNTVSAPNTNINWKITDSDGRESDDIVITSLGVVTARNNASGIYTLEGWDRTGRYSTSKLYLKVFKYFEYEVGLVPGATIEVNDQCAVIRYYMESRWKTSAANLIYSQSSHPLAEALLICYPQDGMRHVIAQNGNYPEVFTLQLEEESSYNYQFTPFDYLVPQSYLIDQSTGKFERGIKGVPYKFFYIREDPSGRFYNDPGI